MHDAPLSTVADRISCTGDADPLSYRNWLEQHDEIGDLANHILDSSVSLTLSAAEMRARFGPEFSVEEYEEALRRIRDQGG